MRRLLHVITGLNPGGAETMCASLVPALAGSFHQQVVSLLPLPEASPDSPLARLRKAGVDVIGLGLERNPTSLWKIARLPGLVRAFRPDSVQTWMYHADLLGGLAALALWPAGRPPVCWGIHNTLVDAAVLPRTTRLTVAALARLSPWLPRAVVCCAAAARQAHEALGYRPRRWEIIPNGVDLQRFRLDAERRARMRAAWRESLDLPESALLAGHATRDHPVKDLPTFARAAAVVLEERPETRFVLCGQGMAPRNDRVAGVLGEAGVLHACRLLGMVQDMPAFWNAVDLAVSSSRGEASPLTLAEAMARGVPVAATDVGDTALLTGEGGLTVPPGDGPALGRAMLALLRDGERREAMGLAARRRVATLFSLESAARRYADLHRELGEP